MPDQDPYATPEQPKNQTLTTGSGQQYFYSSVTKQWYPSAAERDAAERDPNGAGAQPAQTGGVTGQLNANDTRQATDAAARQNAANGQTAINAQGDKTQTTANQDTASIVDRYSDVSYDPSLSDASRAQQAQALGMNQQIYDALSKYDPEESARHAADLQLKNQIAIARSAPGGAGARQAAMFSALEQAPAIQQAAGQQARQQQQLNQQQMLTAAAQSGQIAAGTREADLAQQQAQTNTGLQIANGIASALGRHMDITASDANMLTQAQIALQGLKLNWSTLTEQQREAQVNEALEKAGLDERIKEFAAKQKLTLKDIAGAAVTLGSAGIEAGGRIAAS